MHSNGTYFIHADDMQCHLLTFLLEVTIGYSFAGNPQHIAFLLV